MIARKYTSITNSRKVYKYPFGNSYSMQFSGSGVENNNASISLPQKGYIFAWFKILNQGISSPSPIQSSPSGFTLYFDLQSSGSTGNRVRWGFGAIPTNNLGGNGAAYTFSYSVLENWCQVIMCYDNTAGSPAPVKYYFNGQFMKQSSTNLSGLLDASVLSLFPQSNSSRVLLSDIGIVESDLLSDQQAFDLYQYGYGPKIKYPGTPVNLWKCRLPIGNRTSPDVIADIAGSSPIQLAAEHSINVIQHKYPDE